MQVHAQTTLPGLGGFLPLELPRVSADRAIATPHAATYVNSGRNALLLIAQTSRARKVYLPMLGCGVLAQPLTRNGIEVGWYRVGRDLLPAQLPAPRAGELVVLTDLYGLVGADARSLAAAHGNAVLDLTHSSLDPAPCLGPWFASYRKMLGFADGAVAVIAGVDVPVLELDHSAARLAARLERVDQSPEAALAGYQAAEADLDDAPLLAMSNLTAALLSGVDQVDVAATRWRNYQLLEKLLRPAGVQRHGPDPSTPPFCWLLRSSVPGLHAALYDQKIYAPKLWPDVAGRAGAESDEAWVSEHCIPLPVDQHLSMLDVEEIARRVIQVVARIESPTMARALR